VARVAINGIVVTAVRVVIQTPVFWVPAK
jgi:hypothetical protein